MGRDRQTDKQPERKTGGKKGGLKMLIVRIINSRHDGKKILGPIFQSDSSHAPRDNNINKQQRHNLPSMSRERRVGVWTENHPVENISCKMHQNMSLMEEQEKANSGCQDEKRFFN